VQSVCLVGMTNGPGNTRAEFLQRIIQDLTGYGGTLTGTVMINKTGDVLEGATVEIPAFSMNCVTDGDGHFMMERIPLEQFVMRCDKRGYTPREEMAINFNGQHEMDIEIRLLHPELEIDPAAVTTTLDPGESDVARLGISNPGDGPLVFDTYARGVRAEGRLWDEMATENTGRITNDARLQAVVFFQDHFWVAGGVAHDQPNMLYKLDRNFRLVSTVPQASESNYGWRDLTCDENYLYGVDTSCIVQVDPATGLATGVCIPSPLDPTFAVAWDSEHDIFWVANVTSDIFAIDREGNTLMSVENNRRFRISGMFYFPEDEDGYKLYLLNNDATGAVRLMKVNYETGEERFVTDLQVAAEERSGGCSITNELYPFTWTVVVQMQAAEDWVRVYEAASDFYWLDYSPHRAELASEQELAMEIGLSTEGLERGHTYEAFIQFNHNTPVEEAIWVNVAMTVQGESVADKEGMPAGFGLASVYPNPFNAKSAVAFNLDRAAEVELAVYDLAGRRMAVLADGYRAAGSYRLALNAADWPSGVYLLRLSDGVKSDLRKVTLLR